MALFKPTANLKSPGAFAQPTKCGCFAAKTAGAQLEKSEVTRRALGPHDVAIQIKFVGICHSDIHQAREEWDPATFPMVPGHEIIGVVVATGLVELSFQPGDIVGIGPMVNSFRKAMFVFSVYNSCLPFSFKR
jgi:D-arabinose 1-dehydrogenase-like Zn-dependent alcohol dehydrogenase